MRIVTGLMIVLFVAAGAVMLGGGCSSQPKDPFKDWDAGMKYENFVPPSAQPVCCFNAGRIIVSNEVAERDSSDSSIITSDRNSRRPGTNFSRSHESSRQTLTNRSPAASSSRSCRPRAATASPGRSPAR